MNKYIRFLYKRELGFMFRILTMEVETCEIRKSLPELDACRRRSVGDQQSRRRAISLRPRHRRRSSLSFGM